MRICAVTGCRTNAKNCGEDLSLHRFSKNSDIKRKWMEALYQSGEVISNHRQCVCSKHFEPECFSALSVIQRRLLPNAVPSLFLRKDKPTRGVCKKATATRKHLNFDEEAENVGIVDSAAPAEELQEKVKSPSCEINSDDSELNLVELSDSLLELPSVDVVINKSSTGAVSNAILPHSLISLSNFTSTTSLNPSLVTSPTEACVAAPLPSLPSFRSNSVPAISNNSNNKKQVRKVCVKIPLNCSSTSTDEPPKKIFMKTEVTEEDTPRKTILKETIRKQDRQIKTLEKYVNMNSKAEVEDTLETAILKKAIIDQNRKIKTLEESIIMNSKSEVEDTPRKVSLKETLKKKNRQIKTLQDSVYRKSKRVLEMKEIIKELKNKRLMEDDDLALLKCIGGPHNEFLTRQISVVTNQKLKKKYEADLRAFALTLHYKSPNAYNYVRKVFVKALPSTRTLARWYKVIDGEPGFTSESFTALNQKYAECNEPIFGALIIDEMHLYTLIETDGKRYYGFVNMGADIEYDGDKMATEALTFMLVCVNGTWKLPLGYFLTAGVSGLQKANLVIHCLRLLHEQTKVTIISLTCDGPNSNKTMFNHLGCNFDDMNNLKTWFENPWTNQKVYAFFDSCHMIKLVRNTLGECGIIYDENLKKIEWSSIKSLHELQETEGLRLGNKIRGRHIFFQLNKMKVSFAVQVISTSVADALQFLKEEEIEPFLDVDPLITFLRKFDSLFDVLNSKSIKQQRLKQPLCKENYGFISSFLDEMKRYILSLQCDILGTPITSSSRHTGFLGFLVDIESIKGLYQDLILTNLLPFFPTHKVCQDHLELFFGIIRGRFGYSRNPTARHFLSAYKRCIVHMELQSKSTGNCIPIENITILTCSAPEKLINVTTAKYKPTKDGGEEDIDAIFAACAEEIDHYYCFQPTELTVVVENVLYHIAGAIVRGLLKCIKCPECVSVLCAPENEPLPSKAHLFRIKERGGLVKPSSDVVHLIKSCEKFIRTAQFESAQESNSDANSNSNPTESRLMKKKFTAESLTVNVIQMYFDTDMYNKLFINLKQHSLSK